MLVRARDSRNLLRQDGEGRESAGCSAAPATGHPASVTRAGAGAVGCGLHQMLVRTHARSARANPMQYEISSSKSWYVHSEPRRLTCGTKSEQCKAPLAMAGRDTAYILMIQSTHTSDSGQH